MESLEGADPIVEVRVLENVSNYVELCVKNVFLHQDLSKSVESHEETCTDYRERID